MDFIIIANAWGAGADNPTSKHRIAIELSRRGHCVLWVEGAGMRRPSLGSGHDRGRILRKLRQACRGARRVADRTWVVAPLLVPMPSKAWIRKLNGWIYRRVMRRCSRKLGFEAPVLVNYVPVLSEAMKTWHGGRIVYHCVDRWDAFDMYDSALMAEVDRQCCELADVVIATSEDLYQRCRTRCASCHLIMHGVDHAHFATALESPECPADLPDGDIVGFFGLLSEWVDQDLLVRLAGAVPSAHLVLIGMADVDISALERLPNIHILGPKPFCDLPAYIARFRVGIIPFVVNELTRAVNPIKLREMLAAGCPVVSTALPEVKRFEGVGCRVSGGREDFVAAVKQHLDNPLPAEHRKALSDSMTGETWEAKVTEMLASIEHRTSNIER